MEYAADEINVGYRTCLLFINSENTLVDKLSNITEITPGYGHQGGVEFNLIMKSMETDVQIMMNYNGNFNIVTETKLGKTVFIDETVETLINFLHIFYINMKSDEDTILKNALDPNTYRKAAKSMHYRELFGWNIEE